jgi:hypothetical protein
MIDTVIPPEVRRTASALRHQAERSALDAVDDLRASAEEHVERVAARWDGAPRTGGADVRPGLLRWRPGTIVVLGLLAVATAVAAGRVRRVLVARRAGIEAMADAEPAAAAPQGVGGRNGAAAEAALDEARHVAAGAVAPQGQMASGQARPAAGDA